MKNSYLCPLFWQHHESEAILREEIRRMDENGIGSFIVESRPHPHYLKEEWWSDLSILLDEAKKRDMGVWIFDDGSYPSGTANGLLFEKYPQYIKQYLAHHYVDAIGPKSGASVLVEDWLEEDEKLVCIIAGRRVDGRDEMDPDSYQDITEHLHNGVLYWDIPQGEWRIFIFKQTHNGGEEWTKHYLNPLDPEGAAAFIELIYEEHYRHFKDDFGKTIRGFFMDEPRFGNASGYARKIGQSDMVLPWSDTLLAELSGVGLGDFKRLLPALFYPSDTIAPDARYAYMDAVSKRFGRHFVSQVGDWCRAHKVRLIGHVVEENGAHARLGFGSGHYFRSMDGMDAAGIDVVDNIYPGRTDGKFLTLFNDYDTTFNHWGLSKLASSAAHIDPKKQDMTMCEAFGAYGWSEGLRAMKWITDAMAVRGVNFIVPHAFSPKEFPDPDCPPHFYARGNNPQFPFFHVWSGYANRVCAQVSGGKHLSPVAVLYHAEAEWGGAYQPFEEVVKCLMRSQLDCDVLPADVLADTVRCRLENGRFTIHKESYCALVVPYAQYLPACMKPVLEAMAQNDIPVFFVKGYPQRYYFGVPFEQQAGFEVSSVDDLAGRIHSKGIWDVRLQTPCKHLAYYHYQKEDADYYFFTNEDIYRDADVTVAFNDGRAAALYDAMDDRWYTAQQTRTGENASAVSFVLKPYQSIFVVFGKATDGMLPAADCSGAACVQLPQDGWQISTKDYQPGSVFVPQPYQCLGNISAPDKLPAFSGTVCYETTFVCDAAGTGLLRLGEVYESVRVFVNDVLIGERICPPYDFELASGVLHSGRNTLRIEVANTLAKAHHDDPFDRYWVQDPSGLMGPVQLLYKE